jgi:hypothetical protein
MPTQEKTVDAAATERDPLDIPFSESGYVPPVYYNPHSPGRKFYVHAMGADGRSHQIYKGVVKEGTYRWRLSTPREELYIRDDISTCLNGNPPDRWIGENLEEDDRWFCDNNSCGFTTRNTKVAVDHQRNFGHRQKLIR